MKPFGDSTIWDFKIFPRIYKTYNEMNIKDKIVFKLIVYINLLYLGTPFFYTPGAFKIIVLGYIVTKLGITTSYHR